LGSASLPSVALVLALAHLGYERWLTWPVVGMLVGLPAVAIPLIIWNPGHVMIAKPRLVTVLSRAREEHSTSTRFAAQ